MYCCILLYHSISVLTLHLLTAFSSVNSFGVLRILKFCMNFIFFYCLQTLNDNMFFQNTRACQWLHHLPFEDPITDGRVWSYFFPLGLPVREGNGTPLQYSCLENPVDGGAWQAAVHGVTKSWTQLSDFPFTFYFHALEKEIATHSSVFGWKIPGTEEPGRLPSTGSHRVGQN